MSFAFSIQNHQLAIINAKVPIQQSHCGRGHFALLILHCSFYIVFLFTGLIVLILQVSYSEDYCPKAIHMQ